MTKLSREEVEQISSMLEDGLVCDISKFKLTAGRYIKTFNREQYFSDSDNRYLDCYNLRIYEYYHKWSKVQTRVGKDDDVYVFEDRSYFFMYKEVCVKAKDFCLYNNVGLPRFEYELPVRVKSEREGWIVEEVKEITFLEELTKDFYTKLEQFIDSIEQDTHLTT